MNLSASTGHLGRHAVSFVLIEPSHPGNVGSAARALQVMGFERLILVNPRFDSMNTHPEAVAFASGAGRVLNACQTVGTLAEAASGARMTVAVSAAGREFAPPPSSPREIARTAVDMLETIPTEPAASTVGKPMVALVFGTERVGLSIAQAQMCSHLCTIDADPAYSSLNLAQALQIIAYEMRSALVESQSGGSDPDVRGAERAGHPDDWPATHDRVEGMLAHLEKTLVTIGYLDPAQPKRLMPRLRQLFSRAALTSKEVDIWRGICQKIDRVAKQEGAHD
ncbi:MAG: RNA methyltransferase [Burkholderiaceae bacterium]